MTSNSPTPGAIRQTTLALALLAASGNAWSENATLQLEYSCVFPILEEQPLSVAIDAKIPSSVSAGEQTEAFEIDATATVSEDSWNGLSFVGTETLEGDVVASSNIRGQAIDLDLQIPLGIEPVTLPTERTEFDVNASGKTIPLVFSEDDIGDVYITVGGVVMSLGPRDTNGNLTGLGRFQSECQLKEGQDTLLQTIRVTGDEEPMKELAASGDGELRFPSTDTAAAMSANLSLKGGETLTDSSLSLAGTNADFKIVSLFNAFSLDTEIQFEPAGKLSGNISDTQLEIQAGFRLTMPRAQMKLFGLTLSDGGGSECRTAEAGTLRLSSRSGGWDQEGGRFQLSGTMDIPEFEGCGNLNNLINRHVAGTEKTVELNMTTNSINGQ